MGRECRAETVGQDVALADDVLGSGSSLLGTI